MHSQIASVRPLTFIRLATQFENAGDCLINRELVRLVAEHSDICLDAHKSPSGFAQQVSSSCPPDRLRFPSWSFYGAMLRERLRNRTCYWFLMPGAITRARRRESRFQSALRDLPLRLASLIGVRVCQVGTSFGELTDRQIEVWRRRRRWLFRLSPRDRMSAAFLESCDIVCDPVIPDLAFELFDAARRESADRVPHLRNACLSFRTDQYDRQSADVAAVAQAVCQNRAPHTNWRILAQVARDRKGMEILRDQLMASGVQLPPVEDLHLDVERCLAFYRGQSLVVSNRLHALLMGASQGARILAVAEGRGGDKLTGLLRDLGLQEAIVDPRNLSRAGTSAQLGLLVDGLPQREQLRLAFDELFRSDNSNSARN